MPWVCFISCLEIEKWSPVIARLHYTIGLILLLQEWLLLVIGDISVWMPVFLVLRHLTTLLKCAL